MQVLDPKTETEVFTVLKKFYVSLEAHSMEQLLPVLHPQVKFNGITQKGQNDDPKEVSEALIKLWTSISKSFHMESQTIQGWQLSDKVLLEDQIDFYTIEKGNKKLFSTNKSSFVFSKESEGWRLSYLNLSLPNQIPPNGGARDIQQLQKENQTLHEQLDIHTQELALEAALEKVRTRTMAIQESHQLGEVIQVVFQEIKDLGLDAKACDLVILNEDTEASTFWVSGEGIDGQTSDELIQIEVPPLSHYHYQASIQNWRAGTDLRKAQLLGEDCQSYMRELIEYSTFSDMSPAVKDMLLGLDFIIHTEAYFQYGFFRMAATEELPDEHTLILQRFTKVFEQSYTRFLDLQKAEKQAREAQIEVALERIRSKSIEIRSSHELKEVVNTMFQELKNLGVQTATTDVEIYFFDEPTATAYLWGAEDNLSSNFSNNLSLPLLEHPTLKHSFKKWKATPVENRKQLFIVNDLLGAELEEMIQFIETIPHLVEAAQLFRAAGIQRWLDYSALFTHGLISLQGPEPVSIETQETLQRFSHVFEQAYTRFLDLQKAEAQTREVQIEVALERVRARGMAMRESKELSDTAQVLFQQLETLGIETWAAGFNIWEKDTPFSMAWMSLLGQLHDSFRMPHNEDPSFIRIFQHRKKEASIYVEALGGEDLQKHYQYISSLQEGSQQVTEELIASGVEVPERPSYQVFNAAYFKFGYLMFITYEVNSDHEETFQRFAQVFEQSYVRFLDLKRAEEQAGAIEKEKIRLEKVLLDLQATQAQLIQQEKLASLGQLTAGIAHEIKNPLNFVNNFSDLSAELIDEVFEELTAIGPSSAKEEIIALLSDIRSNLQKIHQHGNRADNIVKSMLQHSRGSSGQTLPTPLNAFLNEFVNLAFHGMRANKNPINVSINLQFDEKIGSIELLREDFSRVILNLCNNAFDALRNRTEQDPQFQAKLDIRTLLDNAAQRIIIMVTDNGPGIPKTILDKVLQPFFTTKKGTAGTGLGLSISNDIVKAHGGSLEVQSKVGEGTTFLINLRA